MITTRLKMMLGTAMLMLASQHALAADPIRFALCMDMTKSYPFITVPYVQGVRDYAALINSKGGIESHPVEIIIVEHGNEPQRGIECYERMKDQAITVDFLSTPVAKGVLPRAMKDGKVMIQAIAGRGDAVDGEVFEWVFPLGATYWGQAANIISHFKKQSGGSLKGKKIAFLHLDHPFSFEPLPVLQELQKREGFDLQLFPYPPPGSDQSSAWSQIRRVQPRPDRALGLLADECGGRQGGYAQWHPDGQDRHGQLLERCRHQQHRARRRQGNQAIDDRGKRYRPGAGSGDRSRAVRQGQGCG